MSSWLRFLPSRIPGSRRSAVDVQSAPSSAADVHNSIGSEKDVKEKESSSAYPKEVQGGEITTAKDPTLNPGELSFEEGVFSSY
jgi:hypothetical protein